MAGRLTLWGAGEILRSFFGKSSQPPEIFYLALIKDRAPTPYSSGSELFEPDPGAGYARVAIQNTAPMWVSDSGQLHIVTNEEELTFITAVADWGQISYWAICNADVGGQVYFVGSMEESLYVLNGDRAIVGAGELTVELGPFFTDEEF